MNWTASLLREELRKERLTHQARINLLTNINKDAQNFLLLEEKLALLTKELEISKQNIAQLANELKNQAKLSSQEIKDKEISITNLEKKITISKNLISDLQKQICELNIYHQREMKRLKERGLSI